VSEASILVEKFLGKFDHIATPYAGPKKDRQNLGIR
jgi:hypothetical protein